MEPKISIDTSKGNHSNTKYIEPLAKSVTPDIEITDSKQKGSICNGYCLDDYLDGALKAKTKGNNMFKYKDCNT